MRGGLSIRNLVVRRGGRQVVSGVDLDVPAGEIVALLGANGAGKSSTVLGAAGLIEEAAGDIALDGRQIGSLPALDRRRAGLAIVAEGHHVLPGLTVRDNVAAAAFNLGKSEAAIEIERVIALFPELKDRLSVDAQMLSGGQKQMVNIAQALVSRPKFLLVDELSLGLAPAVVNRLGDLLIEIAGKGVGILLIEQFTTLALRLASRAAVLERGAVVFTGTAQTLAEHPEILHKAYLTEAGH
jgi:branched-chain amino acid transport system ATP-binding protein